MIPPDSPVDRWPPELRVVVACLRAVLGLRGGAPEVLPEALLASSPGHADRREPDWQRFLFWVERHRVTPLVYRGLGMLGPVQIPEETQAELRRRVDQNALRMLQLGGELVRLIEALDGAAIRVLPLKGPILALQVHGDVTMRQVKDLDLLVASSDVEGAMQVLRRAGYRPVAAAIDRFSATQWRHLRASFNQVALFHPETGVPVELHWKLLNRLWPLPFEDVVERTASVELAGRPIQALGPVDLLNYLALHGSAHGWRRLSWLAELGRLVPETDDDTWRRVIDSATSAGVERPLRHGLVIARQVLGAPLPAPVRTWVEQDRAAPALARTALANIADGEGRIWFGLGGLRLRLPYLLRLRRSPIYRLRVLRSLVNPPADVVEVALPARLGWLYYLLRPFLWVRRRWRGLRAGRA